MSNHILIKNKIGKFNKKIFVSGDKSISIRWVLFASIASGISKARNLLISEDVLAAINIIKKFGIKVVHKNGFFLGNGSLEKSGNDEQSAFENKGNSKIRIQNLFIKKLQFCNKQILLGDSL